VREHADEQRMPRLMQALGDAAPSDGDCCLAGGSTAAQKKRLAVLAIRPGQ